MKRLTEKRKNCRNETVYILGERTFAAAQKLGRIEDFEEKIGYPVEDFLWVIEDKIKEWEEIRKEYLKERGG